MTGTSTCSIWSALGVVSASLDVARWAQRTSPRLRQGFLLNHWLSDPATKFREEMNDARTDKLA